MRNPQIERALLRRSGHEHSVTVDSIDGRVVGCQVEVGLHLVRVMALETLVTKDRQHVILIVDFVSGIECANRQQTGHQNDITQITFHYFFSFRRTLRFSASLFNFNG